jgi:hypothetical protein
LSAALAIGKQKPPAMPAALCKANPVSERIFA